MSGLSSMTGFGTASGENGRFRVTVELRTVNHRGLDLALRLRDECRAAEPELRALLKQRLHRGRVEMSVVADPVVAGGAVVEIDRALAQALAQAASELRHEGLIEGGLVAGDLLRLPGLVRIGGRDGSWGEEDTALVLEVASAALELVLETRRSEGATLADELRRGLERLREVTAELAGRREEVTRHYLEQLQERLRALVGDALPDRQRLEQEVALLVEKSDVLEELDRLRAHVEHGERILESESPAGRRFDVLLQEMLRELSTLGAKCRDLEMSRTVMAARLVSEQLREQVQNVE